MINRLEWLLVTPLLVGYLITGSNLFADTYVMVVAGGFYWFCWSSPSRIIAVFFLLFLGYTMFMVHVKPWGHFIDFMILQIIAIVCSSYYLNVTRFKRSADKVIVFTFWLVILYLSGMVREWDSDKFSIFDAYYGHFMVGCYASILYLEIKSERIQCKVVKWRADRVKSREHKRIKNGVMIL